MKIVTILLMVVNSGIGYSEDAIIFLQASEESLSAIERRFITTVEKLGFNVIPYPEKQSFIFKNTYGSEINVVSLHAKKFCDLNSYEDFMESNMIYVGDENENFTIPSEDCGKYDKKYAKMFSYSIIKNNYVRLYNMIVNDNYDYQDHVVICLPTNIPDDRKLKSNLRKVAQKLELNFQEDCHKNVAINKSTIAVISNTELSQDTLVPTVYYHVPYFLPEYKDITPNSMRLLKSWRPLAYAMRYFLENMYWYRVGIISDDSEYSEKFLETLKPLLDEDRFVYNAQECMEMVCDFKKGLHELKRNRARIVIVNIGHEKAEILIRNINNINIYGVTWIVRDWPFSKLTKIENGDVFSVTLSPRHENEASTNDIIQSFERSNSQTPCHFSAISKALEIVRSNYIASHGDLFTFTTKFKKQANRSPAPSDILAYVFHTESIHFQNKLVYTMKVEGENVIEIFKDVTAFQRSDLPEQCIVRSSHFNMPCDHDTLSILLCVAVMFVLFFFIVLLFFTMIKREEYNRFF